MHFDFVCPWCLIGLRHLRTAVAQFGALRPDVRIDVRWRSVQLLPDIPADGVPYEAFYVARLGSAEGVAARRAQVQQAAAGAGLRIAFDRIRTMPNTALAHAVFGHAVAHGTREQQDALVERLFMAWFLEGEDIGDAAVLERHAVECGLDREPLQVQLAAWRDRTRLPSAIGAAVSGVPAYAFDGVPTLSGAVPPAMIVQAMARHLAAKGC
jgi:predicted DsbA family dithiol-disulfide isomerase